LPTTADFSAHDSNSALLALHLQSRRLTRPGGVKDAPGAVGVVLV
jgi:hypothetical protein